MIITLIMLIVIIAVLAVYNLHSKLNSIFIMIMVGLFVILFSLVMYITKTSYYNGIFNLEIWIYQYMRKIQINITQIKVLLTLGYLIIFLSQILIFREIGNSCSRRMKSCITIISLILVAGFLTMNAPDISEIIYINVCAKNTYFDVILFDKILTIVNYAIVVFFLILPIPPLVSGIITTQLIFIKKHNIEVAIILIFVELIILIMSFLTKIKNLMSVFMMYMFDAGSYKLDEFSALLPLSVIAVLAIVLVGCIRFDIFNTVDFFKARIITRRMKVFLMDLKYIFHDFKNIMMTIIALKSVVAENYGTDEGIRALNKIEETAYNYAEKIEELLDVYKSKKIVFSEADLLVCLKNAVTRISAECEVPVYIKNLPENPVIKGDSYQLEILFYNILKNAAESIETKKNPDGIIEIKFIEEKNWICVDFLDNGIGMSIKERKRIWRLFSSSKNTFLNWGIGLNQVKNIIEAHLGHIDLKSKKDKFTQIQTSFPKAVQ